MSPQKRKISRKLNKSYKSKSPTPLSEAQLLNESLQCLEINTVNELGLILDSFGIPGPTFLKRFFEKYSQTLTEPLSKEWPFEAKPASYRKFASHIMANRKIRYISNGQLAAAVRVLSSEDPFLKPAAFSNDANMKFGPSFEKIIKDCPENQPLIQFILALWEGVLVAFRNESRALRPIELADKSVRNLIAGPPYSGRRFSESISALTQLLESEKTVAGKSYPTLEAIRTSNDLYRQEIMCQWIEHSSGEPMALIGLASDPAEFEFSFGYTILNDAVARANEIPILIYDPLLSSLSKSDTRTFRQKYPSVAHLVDRAVTLDQAANSCHSILINMPIKKNERAKLQENYTIDLFSAYHK